MWEMTAKGVKKPDCDSQQKKKDIWRSMTSSNKDAQYNSWQNAVRPPISAAVAFFLKQCTVNNLVLKNRDKFFRLGCPLITPLLIFNDS